MKTKNNILTYESILEEIHNKLQEEQGEIDCYV